MMRRANVWGKDCERWAAALQQAASEWKLQILTDDRDEWKSKSTGMGMHAFPITDHHKILSPIFFLPNWGTVIKTKKKNPSLWSTHTKGGRSTSSMRSIRLGRTFPSFPESLILSPSWWLIIKIQEHHLKVMRHQIVASEATVCAFDEVWHVTPFDVTQMGI